MGGAITRLMAAAAPPRDKSETGLNDSDLEESTDGELPGDPQEEQGLFDFLHGLRALVGTLGRLSEGEIVGVPQVGELWNERYEVQAALGSGAAGHVRLAYDRHLPRQVALKFPRVELGRGEDRRDDLLRDAQVAARFNHPGILTVHELIIPAQGNPCVVMPYCEGGSLHAWLQAYPEPLDPRMCVRLVRELAEATQYAHERQVVHRDLKPENILLQSRRGLEHGAKFAVDTRPDRLLDEWQPRIADFGLALVRETATLASKTPHPMGGTLWYMAPEQIRGQVTEFGPATDVHALGVLLKELLTGQALRHSADATPVRPVRSIAPELRRIIEHCTAPAFGDRYSTCRQLVDDLRRWEHGEPVHAGRTPSLSDHLGKWLIRHRRSVGWITVAMLLIFWGGLAFSRLPSRIEREWARWGEIPTDFPFAGIEHAGNGSVHLDAKTRQLVIVATRARMAKLGDLPPGGDLDLCLDLELPNDVDDCGFFFGYRAVEPTHAHPECARLHVISLTRGPHGKRDLTQSRRNIAVLLPGDGWIRTPGWGQLEQLPRRDGDEPLRLPRVTRLRLKIVRGIVEEVAINGRSISHFQGTVFNRHIDEDLNPNLSVHDLNVAGPFGVYVNSPRTLAVSLPQAAL
jgi:serine/threonine protein kinase